MHNQAEGGRKIMICYVSLILTESRPGGIVNYSQETSIWEANTQEEALGMAIARRKNDGKSLFLFSSTEIGSKVDELRKGKSDKL